MPTTTNYGWTTPADTDLVKDGASAIRTLGNSIDSTLKTQIDAQIPDSIVTTKGDLISATAASTPARLAVGTNGQVLTADSTTSTGLKWATAASGGMTSLATGTLSGATVTLSSISQDYNDLYLVIYFPSMAAGSVNPFLLVQQNAVTTDYKVTHLTANSTTVSNNQTRTGFRPATDVYVQNGNTNDIYTYYFPVYKQPYNRIVNFSLSETAGSTGYYGFGWVNDLNAITTLKITTVGGSNFDAGTYILYGVK